MNVAVLIPPTDFRDETVASAVELLNKWNVEPVIASWTRKDCTGYHGAVYTPKIIAPEINTEDYDAIFIPDGAGIDTYKLYDLRQLLDTIKHFAERGKPIACVNNAIKILARANVITNKKIAAVKDAETARLVVLFHGKITNSEVESDGGVLTLSNNDKTTEFVDLLLDRLGVR